MLRFSFPPPGQLPGTATNDTPAAGNVGEYISAQLALGSAVALTTGTPVNLTSIPLTAGDWEVWAAVWFSPAATTSITQLIGSHGTTSGVISANLDHVVQDSFAAEVPTALQLNRILPMTRYLLAASGTIFLNAQATFTVAGLSAYGIINARRRR